MYIAVAGNIGSGKSTLTRMLARHYKWESRFEAVDNNPYLEDYYNDIKRWSFNLEVFFLKERFRDLIAIPALSYPRPHDIRGSIRLYAEQPRHGKPNRARL